MIWFTADHHFGHANIIKYTNRPYHTVHEMNFAFTMAWNDTVKDGDLVYFLGDLSMKKNKVSQYLERLNGEIVFIVGNHDWKSIPFLEAEKKILGVYKDPLVRKIPSPEGMTPVVMTHVPMDEWEGQDSGTIHLHAHSHGASSKMRNRFDVGVDVALKLLGEPRPFSIDEILQYLRG